MRLQDIDYGLEPALLLFGDNEPKRADLAHGIASAGGRIASAGPLAIAIRAIADHAGPHGIVVRIEEDDDLADELLRALDQNARSGRCPSIALIPTGLIDLAMARAPHENVALLCDSTPADLAFALGTLVARRPASLHDIRGDAETRRLRELSAEVERIARTLSALSVGERDIASEIPTDATVLDAPSIRAMIRARRLRDQYFAREFFADPAWDMLLDLMAARLEGRQVAVSSLCIAAAVPPTTALRWIKTLTDGGLLVRVADPHDKRRVHIELAPAAANGMTAYLAAARAISPAAI